MADKDRFFQLLEPLMENLERYVLNLSRNRELAKDIVSSAVLSAYDNFHKLRQEKAFLSYLFSIASRIYYAEIKRSRRENGDRFQSIGAGQDVAVMFQSEISPEDRTDINILYNVMDRLEDRQREALILAELMGFSHREVADIQGSTVAAVKVRIHRAKKRLGAMLSDSSKFLVPSSKEEREKRSEIRDQSSELRDQEESSQFTVLSSQKESSQISDLRSQKDNRNGKIAENEERASGIQNRESNIENPASRIEHRILTIDGSERSFYERN